MENNNEMPVNDEQVIKKNEDNVQKDDKICEGNNDDILINNKIIDEEQSKKKSIIPIIVVAVVGLIAIISLVLTLVNVSPLKASIASLKDRNIQLQESNDKLSKECDKLTEDIKNNAKRDILLKKEIDKINLELNLSNAGIVTDAVYIETARVYTSENDKIYVYVDVLPQPLYTRAFLGQGKIDLSDEQIKIVLKNLGEKIYKSFSKYSFDSSHFGSINFTHNNYDLGKYVNGVVQLKGEY